MFHHRTSGNVQILSAAGQRAASRLPLPQKSLKHVEQMLGHSLRTAFFLGMDLSAGCRQADSRRPVMTL